MKYVLFKIPIFITFLLIMLTQCRQNAITQKSLNSDSLQKPADGVNDAAINIIGDSVSLTTLQESRRINYMQTPGKELHKLMNNNGPVPFTLITDGINSFFEMTGTVSDSTKTKDTKNYSNYKTAVMYRNFKTDKIVYKINVAGKDISYFKPAEEFWQTVDTFSYNIKGFSCKKAVSKKYGTAWYSAQAAKRGGPNGIGDLPGLVIKLVTPEQDEFMYMAILPTKIKVPKPISNPIRDDKVNDEISKIVAAKNKVQQSGNRIITTTVVVKD